MTDITLIARTKDSKDQAKGNWDSSLDKTARIVYLISKHTGAQRVPIPQILKT